MAELEERIYISGGAEPSVARWREASDRFLIKALFLQVAIVAVLWLLDRWFGLTQLGAILQHHLLLGISAYIALQTGDKNRPNKAFSAVVWGEVSIISLAAIGALVAIWEDAYGITHSFDQNNSAFWIFALLLAGSTLFTILAHRSADRADGGSDRSEWGGLWLLLLAVNVGVGALFWAETVDIDRGDNPLAETRDDMATHWKSVLIYAGLLFIHALWITNEAVHTRRSVPTDSGEDVGCKPSTLLDWLIWPIVCLWKWLTKPRPKGGGGPNGEIGGGLRLPRIPAVPEAVGWTWAAGVVAVLLVLRPGSLADPVCAPIVGKPAHCVTIYFATPRKPIESADAKLAATGDGFWQREGRDQRKNNKDVDPRPLGFETNESSLSSDARNAGEANALYLGRANVSVPLRKDKIDNEDGSQVIERDAVVEAMIEEKQVTVTSIQLASDFGFNTDPALVQTRYYDRLSDAASKADNKLLLVVHGYNTTFETSLTLAGRYAMDLNAAIGREGAYGFGQPVLFTWPTELLGTKYGVGTLWGAGVVGSAGAVLCSIAGFPTAAGCGAAGAAAGAFGGSVAQSYYDADARADPAAAALRSFLLQILTRQQDGNKEIELNIFAVSLGNAVLARALAGMTNAEVRSVGKNMTIRVISTGGDASHGEFKAAFEKFGARVSSAAIYVNRNDKPLFLSQYIRFARRKVQERQPQGSRERDGHRVGRPENEDPFTISGSKVQTIDATGFSADAFDLFDFDSYQSAINATHEIGEKSPTILADSACFLEGLAPEHRYLRHPETAAGAEAPWWRLEANGGDGKDTRCASKLLRPIDCDSLAVTWFSWWPIRSASEKDRIALCQQPKCLPEVVVTDEVQEPLLVFTPLVLGDADIARDKSFLCGSWQYVGRAEQATCPNAILQPTQPLADALSDQICSQKALVAIGSASSFGSDENLGRRRAEALRDAVNELCPAQSKPEVILLSLGKTQCPGAAACADTSLDRRLTLFGLEDLRAEGGAIAPDLVAKELSYALATTDRNDQAWSALRRAAEGGFSKIEIGGDGNWTLVELSVEARETVRTRTIIPSADPECFNGAAP